MRTLSLVTTGGTIASRSALGGGKVASASAADLVAGLAVPADVRIRVHELPATNSYAMTLSDMDAVRAAIAAELADPELCGVVVTHGTDALEETALLVDLLHADPRPVVFTGAQIAADDPDPDGPQNLLDAVRLVVDGAATGRGVLVCFGGRVLPVWGLTKAHTSARDAFTGLTGTAVPAPGAPISLPEATRTVTLVPPLSVGHLRVDVVAVHPGADRVVLDACVRAGAAGVVLQGTGCGNASPDVVRAVAEHTRAGVTVVLSTRVPAGPVRPVYGGGGGGVDLVQAGAVPSVRLRPGQARVLLAALLAAGVDGATVRRAFDDPDAGRLPTAGPAPAGLLEPPVPPATAVSRRILQ